MSASRYAMREAVAAARCVEYEREAVECLGRRFKQPFDIVTASVLFAWCFLGLPLSLGSRAASRCRGPIPANCDLGVVELTLTAVTIAASGKSNLLGSTPAAGRNRRTRLSVEYRSRNARVEVLIAPPPNLSAFEIGTFRQAVGVGLALPLSYRPHHTLARSSRLPSDLVPTHGLFFRG